MRIRFWYYDKQIGERTDLAEVDSDVVPRIGEVVAVTVGGRSAHPSKVLSVVYRFHAVDEIPTVPPSAEVQVE